MTDASFDEFSLAPWGCGASKGMADSCHEDFSRKCEMRFDQ
jgi:hypothetical protein